LVGPRNTNHALVGLLRRPCLAADGIERPPWWREPETIRNDSHRYANIRPNS
jgi:hypothetical protein